MGLQIVNSTPTMGTISTSASPVTGAAVAVPANAVKVDVRIRGTSTGPGTNDRVQGYWQTKQADDTWSFPGEYLGVLDRYAEDDGGSPGGASIDSSVLGFICGGLEGRLFCRTPTDLVAAITLTAEVTVQTQTDPA